MSAAIFKCTNCQTPLGESVGASLRLYVPDSRTGELIAVEFDEKPVSPRCGKCKRKRVWTPNKRPQSKAA